MFFFILKGTNVDFLDWELWCKTYTTEEALPTTRCVKLVGKKVFAAAALDPEYEIFVVHVASLNLVPGIHPNREARIAFLLTKEVKIPDKYSHFIDVFSKEKALVLPERIELNEHAINLEDGKQPLYGAIYILGPVELETLKIYIEIYLKTGFIWLSKSPPLVATILFDKKPDGSRHLCVDYQGLNNLTIKKQYSLLLIGELINWLGWAKRFTQLDLTSAYYQMRIKEGDKWQTAFQIRYGCFEYQMMLFGLCNAPASFQGYIIKIPIEKLDVFVIMYLDDIFVYT